MIIEMKEDNVEQFISESNFIEGVFDEDSFQQAMYAWHYLSKIKSLTPFVICKTHKILMLNQPILPSDKGYWRNQMVFIGNRSGLPHTEITGAIHHLCINIADAIINGKKESEIWKENICKTHHIEYEKIHGFVDGNGRTGRMFMNWERQKLGLPILVIKEKEKQDYYKWFK